MGNTTMHAGKVLRERLAGYNDEAVVYEYGVVTATGDGIIQIKGLSHCQNGELIEFANDVYAMAMDLSIDGVGAVLLNGTDSLRVGEYARGTGRVVEIPVGDELAGRTVNPIGMPLDDMPLRCDRLRPIECPAPTINDRKNISEAMETGLLAVDSMIPIGRGQRELIIGDRQTGKTTLALDCIINQQGKGVKCVYVAIGQKASTVAHIRHTLKEHGAMDYTTLVVATASDCAAMQYIAPYAGCAIAESFMYDGHDALIVYDDLSKHAIAYRAMSLLLHRPPGREAYPGDIFYLHSRLLERAARLKDELGGGSLTALPIVETMDNDISAYIPTNVISITDGQVYLETELFNAGIRPAINVGLSVSRVGRAAQREAMRAVSGKLRLTLAQYREMQVFSQFGADVDAETRKMLDFGSHLTETLKQAKSSPYSLSEQVVLLLSADMVMDLPTQQVRAWQEGLLRHMGVRKMKLMYSIDQDGCLDDVRREALIKSIRQYKEIAALEGDAHADAE